MKIEKLNDNQIRCTLTREDLASRKLNLSELAYGSDKAKSLFREMMQQAAFECGFEVNDTPLMIEAIPVSADSLVLIITKVEDPEELDTRFAKFAPTDKAEADSTMTNAFSSLKMEGADDILNLFQKIRDAHKSLASKDSKAEDVKDAGDSAGESNEDTAPINLKRFYSFHHLDDVIRVAHILASHYDGINTLYKDPSEDDYILVISKSSHTPEEFNRICNIISEYGIVLKYSVGAEAFLTEHGKVIVADQALQRLAAV